MAKKNHSAYVQGYKYALKKLQTDEATKRNLLSGAMDWLLDRQAQNGPGGSLPETPRRNKPLTEAEKKKLEEKRAAENKQRIKDKLYVQALDKEFKTLAEYGADGVADCEEMVGVFAKMREAILKASANRNKLPTLIPNLWEENAGTLDKFVEDVFSKPYKDVLTSIDTCMARFRSLGSAYSILQSTAVNERNTFMTNVGGLLEDSTVASFRSTRRFVKMLEHGNRIVADLKVKLADIEAEAEKDLAF